VLAFPEHPTAPDPGQRMSVTALPGDRPGSVLVEVTGVVDESTAPLLQLCLDSRTDQSDLRDLVVDLQQVSSLDAAGVAALARAHRRCGERDVRLVLRGTGRLDPLPLTEVADLVGIDPVQPGPVDAGRAAVPVAPPGLSCAAAATDARAALPRPSPRPPSDRRLRTRGGSARC
jgi:anti-sigma B factor antagonist